jgi:hypothetical protein
MVDLPSLRIRPRGQSAATPLQISAQLNIIDPTSEATIGEVGPATNPPAWMRWFLPTILQVREGPDRSLVFSLKRSWRLSPEWLVFDAEQRHIGTIEQARGSNTTRIHDSQGRCLAQLGAGCGEVVGLEGTELATLRRQHGEIELSFAESGELNPFRRMLVLAAVLVCG